MAVQQNLTEYQESSKHTDGRHIDTPAPWYVVDDHEDSEREESILATHPDGYTAEIWRRPDDLHKDSEFTAEQLGSGKWTVEYTDPEGTRRDGSGTFHESPQAAFDALEPHITEVRAERRDRAEQQAEQEAHDWPQQIGRYQLKEATASPTNAEYTTRYLRGRSAIGKEYGEDAVNMRFYDDTRAYHCNYDGEAFARKASAIEHLTALLTQRTKRFDKIEDEATAQ